MKNLKIFNNSRVIVTGHTGFKGSWLTAWLKELGANVMGISLDPPTKPSHYKVSKIRKGIKDIKLDIRDGKKLQKKIISFKPDFVFHLAAQSLVGLSYKNPTLTWQSNVFGTLNILESLRKLKNVCNVVIITSDKCYFNKEVHYGYKETDILGGKDPYSSSKASAELLVKSFVDSFFLKNNTKIRIATARAGNVIGGGDWAKDRIIPDCVRSWSKNKKAQLRNPKATRPWQHVLEAVGGYLCLAIHLRFNSNLHGEPFNFGPSLSKEYSVLEVVKAMGSHWNNVSWKANPKLRKRFRESELLRLNCNKAKKLLGWQSVLKFDEMITMVTTWYRTYYLNPQNASSITKQQIKAYQSTAVKKGLKWAKNF
jgi:CDP-glucose 4,6-dehydratase